MKTAGAQTVPLSTCSQMAIGQGASLNGFVPFPVADAWNQSVTGAAVDAGSGTIVAALGGSVLHPDFGAGTYNGSYVGIPYQVVSQQGLANIVYTAYGSESDQGPMPFPANAPVEGYPANVAGDRHSLVLNRDNCFLYELGGAYVQGDGSWQAAVGAVWDLLGDNDRPYTWTSVDAAGLPVFAGLTRYDEVASGAIHHALRFTVARTRQAFVAPATHWASTQTSVSYAPMGARLRLKASYDTSGFTPQAKVILTALKTYGMIVADNGSNLFLSGAPDSRWDNNDLHNLQKVPASAFEVVQMGTVITPANVPAGAAPVLTSFTASTGTTPTPTPAPTPPRRRRVEPVRAAVSGTAISVPVGTSVTLSWAGSGASYYVVSPGVGAVRGTSAVVKPTVNTTYTLYGTNHFGQVVKTVSVGVY